MALHNSQKKYIKKNRRSLSPGIIAKNLNLPQEKVMEYINGRWKNEKYQEVVNKENNFPIFFSKIKEWIKRNKTFFLLLGVLVFVSYVNALNNNFVSDDHGIEINARFWDFNSFLTDPTSALRRLPYLITYKIFGLNPFFFRITNVILHLGVVWLIYLLVSLTTKPAIGFLTACLFAVHPLLIESVSWIAGGVYVQYSFFFLISFLAYVLYRKNNDKKYYIVSLIAFGFSLFSSEKAASLFLVFPFFDLYLKEFKKNWKKSIPFFLSSVIFAIFYLFVGKMGQRVYSLQSDYQENVGGMDNPFVQIPIAISSYLELIFWPFGLTLYHSEMGFSQIEYIFRFLILLIFLGIIIYFFRKRNIVFFWLSFFIIALLPTLTPFKITWIVAERYVYLGTLGIFAVIATVFEYLASFKKLKMAVYTIFILIIFGLSIRTIVRNVDWQNEDNLWIATGKTSPSSQNTHNNLGDVYGRRGDLQRAVYEFKKAIEIKPNYADAYHNLGNAYRDMGKTDEALKNYQKAVSINPNLWQAYQNIGAVYFYQKNIPKSLEYFQKAISINPQEPNLWLGMGLIYLENKEKDKAREMFTKVLSIDPGNDKAKTALIQLGN
ncbi:tetratricopeptide repeat protein [Candidatus Microgenomates bacterium]|nr:MAG: tetratricopeptide repeat protein [Candidatus Microgenomates bacterium]